ncbi:MAG: phosphohistidine phosphatase SixA [Candidatus Eremiobacteraeota bacterium]|nr:phosphohistidine phosphatase SixA [Candidatus Eremiobacteraeota bacterium]
MKCYFLRHGIAEESSASGKDYDRVLTRDGVRRMQREAKTIAKMDLGLDIILSSPLLRAKQTADIVAEEMKLKHRVVEDPRAGIVFDTESFVAMLSDHSDAGAIMFVGHEPGMSMTIGSLAGGMSIDFKKGSLACVELSSRSSMHGHLVWLVPAKVLAL